MNAPAATQAEGGTLTKPAEWAVYMVTAALKCASDERTASHYVTADEAKHGILKTLNWFEAHDEYEWPDFARLNFDFSQVMRLRRALVQDVYNALQHAGNVKLGVPDTPDSHAGARRGRRSDAEGGTRGNNRKRLCKREAEIDEDAMSEQSQGHDEAQAILLEVMNQLMSRSKCDLLEHLSVDPVTRDASQLADMLHDRLVAAWDAPLREDSDRHDELKQKAETWDRLRRSVPPRSTQRERTAIPRVSPTAPQATVPHATPSPATIKKISGGPAPGSGDPWDFHKRVFTAANSNPKNWADTHTAP